MNKALRVLHYNWLRARSSFSWRHEIDHPRQGREAEIEQSRTHAAHLLQAVLKEAFAPPCENAPISNRLTADSPDFFGVIKQEGRV